MVVYIFEQETDHQWKKGDVLKHLYYAHSFSAACMDGSSDTVVFKLVAEELTSTMNFHTYTCIQAEKPVAMYFYSWWWWG